LSALEKHAHRDVQEQAFHLGPVSVHGKRPRPEATPFSGPAGLHWSNDMVAAGILCFVLAMIAAAHAFRLADPSARMPMCVYLVSYSLTTVVGAFYFGVYGIDSVDSLGYGLATTCLLPLGNMAYWCILFAPFVIPPYTLIALQTLAMNKHSVFQRFAGRRDDIHWLWFLILFLVLTGYCFWQLIQTDYIFSPLAWLHADTDYVAMVTLRTDMFGSMGTVFYGLIYICLPTFSLSALYQCVHKRTIAWRLLFALSLVVIAFLNVAIMLKGLLIIFGIFIALGFFELKQIRLSSFCVNGGVLLVILTTLQALVVDGWQIIDSVKLIFFRMACSFPYYLSLYPDPLPHPGVDLGLHIVGLAGPPRMSVDVFNNMYPSVDWVQGNTPAPAHVMAYSEAGYLYSVGCLFIIGIVIYLSSVAKRNVRGPLSFALHIQLLVCLYYCTQISLREALVSCFGFCWAVIGLSLLYLVNGYLNVSSGGKMPATLRTNATNSLPHGPLMAETKT
jgi:hypothetical protein